MLHRRPVRIRQFINCKNYNTHKKHSLINFANRTTKPCNLIKNTRDFIQISHYRTRQINTDNESTTAKRQRHSNGTKKNPSQIETIKMTIRRNENIQKITSANATIELLRNCDVFFPIRHRRLSISTQHPSDVHVHVQG